jgi:signal transduction histidine kinase
VPPAAEAAASPGAGARAGAIWAAWGAVLLALASTLTLVVRNGELGTDGPFTVIATLMIVGYATVGALIATRTQGNRIGWLMIAIAAAFVVTGLSGEYALFTVSTSPEALPAGSAVAWVSHWSPVPLVCLFVLLVLLFPTGHVASARWRWLPPVLVVTTALLTVAVVLHPSPIQLGDTTYVPNATGVTGLRTFLDAALPVLVAVLVLASLAAIGSLVVRFQQAGGIERGQLRLLTYAIGLSAVFFLGAVLVSVLGPSDSSTGTDVLFLAFLACAGVGVPVACGVAILRYRLYDIDVVINKALVYGLLAGLITLVYLGIVVGLGSLIGRESSALTLLAAVVVAVGFLPVRDVIRRVANRMVYGSRATPYEVLSEFSEGMSAAVLDDSMLPRMARLMVEGTGAREGTVWLRVGRTLIPAASWPPPEEPNPGREPMDMPGEELPAFPPRFHAYPVRHHREVLGALSVRMPSSDPMDEARASLLRSLASQAGLVFRNVRLIEELRASRRRIVTTQDARARTLERNIHDGAQQQLVALNVKLGLLSTLALRDADGASALALQLQSEATEALENLRDLARGVYPPLLADQGLEEALHAQARKAPLPVEVEAGGLRRYPQEIESTVYFCALEALQNAAKHSGAAVVRLRVGEGEEGLRLEVSDDGVGFDPRARGYGTGLQGMADRLAALGGSLEVRSAPGSGTTVVGRVPLSR